jgi:putative inorganic carbon (hco3(-)) transporter
MNKNSHSRVIAADVVLAAMFIIITLLYTLFMFSDRIPLIGLVLLGLLWLVYALLNGRLTFTTPMDFPILGLLAILPISLAISVDHALSLPKVTGLILGISIFYWIVNYIRNFHRLKMSILFLVFLSLVLSLLGLVALDWTSTKFTFLTPLFDILTRFRPSFFPFATDWGIHPNAIGGALAFLIPLLAGLAWDNQAFFEQYQKRGKWPVLSHTAYTSLVIIAFVCAMFLLVLTESRGAYLGSAVGLVVLAIWKDRRFLWLALPLGVGFALFFSLVAEGSINQTIALLDTSNEATITGRLGIWQNTIYMIQDFPLTGAGIGTYSQVFEKLYYASIFPHRTQSYLHAHNSFLAIAIDLGLPALILYVTLLTNFTMIIAKIFKSKRSIGHGLLRGLACGMLAHHIFGLTDAFVMGTKLGVILWIFLGLAAAIFAYQENFSAQKSVKSEESTLIIQKPNRKEVKLRLIDLLVGFGYLLIFSLAAVTFININPYLSIGLATIGGIILSMLFLTQFQKTGLKLKELRKIEFNSSD